jgi:hypothetical protein
MATDLSKPFATQTLDQLLASYMDPTNIANETDPLLRAFMVALVYGDAQGGAIQAQSDATTATTNQLKNLNIIAGWLNGAASRASSQGDTDFQWLGPQQWLEMKSTGDLSNPGYYDVVNAINGVNSPPLPMGKIAENATDPNTFYEATMNKVDIGQSSKNVQLKVDTVSSTAQQDQSYSQMLVGRYTATLTLCTTLLEKRRSSGDNINQNLRR